MPSGNITSSDVSYLNVSLSKTCAVCRCYIRLEISRSETSTIGQCHLLRPMPSGNNVTSETCAICKCHLLRPTPSGNVMISNLCHLKVSRRTPSGNVTFSKVRPQGIVTAAISAPPRQPSAVMSGLPGGSLPPARTLSCKL